MNLKHRSPLIRAIFLTVLPLAVFLGSGAPDAGAAIQYLNDGAVPNPTTGGWHPLPAQGTCPVDTSQKTRPDCLALRFPAYTTSGDCTAAGTGGANRSWSTGVCNDTVNNADQATCEAVPDRKWSNGICSIVLLGDDRNSVVCALHRGTWVTAGTCTGNWIMPVGNVYNPPLVTSNGPGAQCLRCHNAETQYNGARVRDVENFLYTGHKNMARKVTVNEIWGGPPFSCSNPLYTDEQACEANDEEWNPTMYPSDDAGNLIDWTSGTITVGGNVRDMAWIFGDWLAPLPRVIAKHPAGSDTCSIPLAGACSNPAYLTQLDCTNNGGTWTANNTQGGCESNGGIWVANAGASYSCARCHTTGWTSDAAVNTAKEPEKSFPGITWARTGPAVFGQVNTAGGVTGDANKSSSWDVWGVSCSRCHQAVVDNSLFASCSGLTQTTCTSLGGTWSSSSQNCSAITELVCAANSGTSVYNAPSPRSSHHSDLTVFDIASGAGVCSLPLFRGSAQAACDAAGGAWLTACSVAGVCSNPTYTTSGTCLAGSGTWTKYDTQPLCTGAGYTWYTSSCSLAGVCNTLDPAHNTSALCTGAGGQWALATDVIRCLDIHEFGKENDIPEYEAARWNGSNPSRGPIITRLCMDCHRQETGGLPYANLTATAGTSLDLVNPGQYLKVGPAHGTVSFVSHPHGNMLLNSPHGQFTGTFNQVATGKYAFDGSGLYKSYFQMEGEAANIGNGCTGCHDVHESVVPETSPFPAIREECTECHAKNLNLILHPTGTGTPLENMATNPVESCETCHMPGGQHLFRIKADGAYSNFPSGAMTATVNANTSPDGTFTNAVWVDMDHACGQCHGGGTAQVTTTGTIAAGSKVLTVPSTTGFAAGERITIADAGSLTYDDEGAVVNGEFETYIVSVAAPSTVNLAGAATAGVTGVSVVQNITKNGGAYINRTLLGNYAREMHNDKPYVTFGYTYARPNTLKVNLDASGSYCSGSAANCDAYTWDCGAGGTLGDVPAFPAKAVTVSCTYATGGSKSITLTVEEYGVNDNSKSKSVNVYAPEYPPTATSTCSWDANSWTMTLNDTSSEPTPADGTPISQVTVNWGDVSAVSSDTMSPFGPFTHAYGAQGTYTITHKAIDTIGQQGIETACQSTPRVWTTYTISGSVRASDMVTPLGSATIVLRKGTTIVRTLYSAFNGTFSAASLKPGMYSITVTKPGYMFSVPSVTIGPSSSGNIVSATAPSPGPSFTLKGED